MKVYCQSVLVYCGTFWTISHIWCPDKKDQPDRTKRFSVERRPGFTEASTTQIISTTNNTPDLP